MRAEKAMKERKIDSILAEYYNLLACDEPFHLSNTSEQKVSDISR